MSKVKTRYQCNDCGAVSPKWAGQCPECQSWNSLTEVLVEQAGSGGGRFKSHAAAPAQ